MAPATHLRFLLPRLPKFGIRTFATSLPRPAFATGPSPPRLPPKEQEEFERLQKLSTGAFSTPATPDSKPRATPTINQSPASGGRPQINQSPATTAEEVKARIDAKGDGKELHPDVRRGAKPEFEGEVNPKTGEVGGPKNEPLRWGGSGDWSYNGRVTDF